MFVLSVCAGVVFWVSMSHYFPILANHFFLVNVMRWKKIASIFLLRECLIGIM